MVPEASSSSSTTERRLEEKKKIISAVGLLCYAAQHQRLRGVVLRGIGSGPSLL